MNTVHLKNNLYALAAGMSMKPRAFKYQKELPKQEEQKRGNIAVTSSDPALVLKKMFEFAPSAIRYYVDEGGFVALLKKKYQDPETRKKFSPRDWARWIRDNGPKFDKELEIYKLEIEKQEKEEKRLKDMMDDVEGLEEPISLLTSAKKMGIPLSEMVKPLATSLALGAEDEKMSSVTVSSRAGLIPI